MHALVAQERQNAECRHSGLVLDDIRTAIEDELHRFVRSMRGIYFAHGQDGVLYDAIQEYVLRTGKRVRPMLFVLGYLGFKGEPADGLYTSALALELLHDFMLVHDDIIDRADTRRNKPSMHVRLNQSLDGCRTRRFTGQDLAIIAGDVLYALALHAFLAIREDGRRKEHALRQFIATTLHTGSGQFIELLQGLRAIEELSREDVYRIYDLKCGNYTFASPLVIGALLAGADQDAVDKLWRYGKYLGRAFQIKDDIQDLFEGDGTQMPADLKEAKRTLLLWQAFHNTDKQGQQAIRRYLCRKKISRQEVEKILSIIVRSGAIESAREQIRDLEAKARAVEGVLPMRQPYRSLLSAFARDLLG
jgi:geranylgeranyl diphosphate synthase type I